MSFRQCYYLRLCLCPSQTDVFIYMSDLNRKTKGLCPQPCTPSNTEERGGETWTVGDHGNESGNEEKPRRCESNWGSCAFPQHWNSCVGTGKDQRESLLVALVQSGSSSLSSPRRRSCVIVLPVQRCCCWGTLNPSQFRGSKTQRRVMVAAAAACEGKPRSCFSLNVDEKLWTAGEALQVNLE